ncbi:MAG TPA: O-antigen ligase family protein [Nitrosospira sp.]|nr:O-antigen ligase family protein [Nitrosospira sp.]
MTHEIARQPVAHDDEPASASELIRSARAWQNALVKFALFFFGIALWAKWLSLGAGILLAVAWILDNGPRRLDRAIKEPLVLAILILCALLMLGLLWGEYPESGRLKWKRYFAFLVFIPFLSLLNKERLFWAITGLVTGYAMVLLIGVYHRLLGEQGVPLLGMSYLTFSSMLGIGVILSIYAAGEETGKKIKAGCWLLALLLLYLQFNEYGRGALLATLLGSALLVVARYKTEKKVLLAVTGLLAAIIIAFSYSGVLQSRLSQLSADIELARLGKYDTSLGYRLALWDVGVRGIAEKPLFGHGTGAPESYFEKTVKTYKDGVYKDLPQYMETSHYHNDWIEMGMHLGALGVLSFTFLLWSWFQTFKRHGLPVLGAALICFIFISGLADTFALYTKILTFLLAFTAVAISGKEEARGSETIAV